MLKIAGLRQLYHTMSGLSLVLIIAYLDEVTDVYLISALFFLALVIEAARLYLPGINRIFIKYFGVLMRDEETGNPTGTLYYLSGVLISILLFPKEIVLFSMTVLAVGDPIAFIVGSNFGRFRIGRKSLEGSLGFLTASIITGFLLHKLWGNLSGPVIITGALTGTIVELIPLKINDNLTIPVAASAAMHLLSFYVT